MQQRKTAYLLSGWITFIIAFIVYFLTVQRTGSLWDVGEFILGSYKLEIVHPPGAPLFLMVSRIFAWFGEIFSSDPAAIGFAVNLLAGICSAFAAMFAAWTIFHFGKLSLVQRSEETSPAQNVALMLAGIAGGLAAAFCISVWFSAVEGEVYSMSYMFTTLTVWAMMVWYSRNKERKHDKWILFALYAAGLSTGVHLLSLLTLPALALLYYFKKYDEVTTKGVLASLGIGAAIIFFVQKVVIVGLPLLWLNFDKLMVNSFGTGVNMGIIPTVLVVAAIFYFVFRYAHKKSLHLVQMGALAALLIMTGFSTIGMVVVRANAYTPIDMNTPTDPSRLIPYINREQYGDRPLMYGPAFDATPNEHDTKPRFGFDGEKYSIVDYKITPKYKNSDKMLFPRMGHMDQNRKQLYQQEWMGRNGSPTMGENLSFFFRYQMNWMYWRYFMQNFVGRQNALQGYHPGNRANGNWMSGIKFIDEARLYNMDHEPWYRAEDEGRSLYFFLPLLFGLIGMFYLYKHRRRDFLALLVLFFFTGIALIIYANQPPHEPRERDYVFAGSFYTFSIFIGLAILSIFKFLKRQLSGQNPVLLAGLAGVLVLSAPTIMAFQNWDDMGRKELYASRDYAANFLHSLEKDAIIFTYGDNDTYPLWYAQEVENVRPDVRVVNLSLLGVDWYINLLRRQMNDSPPLKLSLSEEAIRGYKRNQVFFNVPEGNQRVDAQRALQFISSGKSAINTGRELNNYIVPANRFVVPINKQKILRNEVVPISDTGNIVSQLVIKPGGNYMTKDDLAIIDIVTNNIHERPIYFATTVQAHRLMGMENNMQLEGLATRIVPVNTPSSTNLGMFGAGRVAEEKIYENVMQDFRWGGFDKRKMFVDESFQPSIQSHRMVMMKAVEEFQGTGETKEAAELAETFFNAFPNMNFPYDYSIMTFLDALIEGKRFEKADEVIRDLLQNLLENEEFYNSLDSKIAKSSFGSDIRINEAGIQSLYSVMREYPNEELKAEVAEKLNPFIQRKMMQQ